MNIVCNNNLLKYFKKISIFKIDLGTNLKGANTDRRGKGEPTIKIKDEFIKKYQTLNNGMIARKYGEIGKLKFYEDGQIDQHEFHIYDKDKVFEIEIIDNDLLKDPADYLTDILKLIDEGDVDENNENNENNMIKNVSYSNMPEDMPRPDMKLNPNNPTEKEKYINDMIARRKILDKLNN
jgi:hypothetical protein